MQYKNILSNCWLVMKGALKGNPVSKYCCYHKFENTAVDITNLTTALILKYCVYFNPDACMQSFMLFPLCVIPCLQL